MASPPVIEYPNFAKENQIIDQTDPSGYSIGGVLSNGDNRPVTFACRNLNKSENNNPTIEKELLSIVWAVKQYRLLFVWTQVH